MHAIKLKITEFIDDWQPGWVECHFNDAWGKEHIIREKAPVVSGEYLAADSLYPGDGFAAFELLGTRKDENGRLFFTDTRGKPWSIETIESLFQFYILED